MTARARAVVAVTGLLLATGALAAASVSRPATEGSSAAGVERTSAPVPMRWVPDWLMEPLSRAIADATDTRDRKAK